MAPTQRSMITPRGGSSLAIKHCRWTDDRYGTALTRKSRLADRHRFLALDR